MLLCMYSMMNPGGPLRVRTPAALSVPQLPLDFASLPQSCSQAGVRRAYDLAVWPPKPKQEHTHTHTHISIRTYEQSQKGKQNAIRRLKKKRRTQEYLWATPFNVSGVRGTSFFFAFFFSRLLPDFGNQMHVHLRNVRVNAANSECISNNALAWIEAAIA